MEDPYYGEVASFVGSFIAAVYLVLAWIVVCKTLPLLRQRLGVTYGMAIALAGFSPMVLIIKGYPPDFWDFMGALFCAGLLFLKYRHALANSAT